MVINDLVKSNMISDVRKDDLFISVLAKKTVRMICYLLFKQSY